MIFSYQFLGEPRLSTLTQLIFERVEQGRVHAVASFLALAEMLATIQETQEEASVQTFVRIISTYPNLSLVPFDNRMVNTFAAIRAQTNILPADCIHIATAQAANADLLISNDYAWRGRFAKPKLILLGDYL
jgi:predicted nucleic acid-binding protein